MSLRKEDLVKEFESLRSASFLQSTSFLLSIFSQAIKGSLSIDLLFDFLKENKHSLNNSLILEITWLLGTELDKYERTEKNFKEFKKNFNSIITQMENFNLVSLDLLLERLDETQIRDSNLIDYTAFTRRRSRINTRLNYVQQKYNLFREQNEGFSKLIIELLSPENLNVETVKIIRNNVYSIIGRFDLDPNRVLDLILEAFQCNADNLFYLDLMENFNLSALPHLLGLKFKNYSSTNSFIPLSNLPSVLKNDPNLTPRSLFLICAHLIKRGFLKLEDIWCHLNPNDSEIEENFNRRVELANKHFKGAFIIALKQDLEVKKKAKELELQEIQEIYNQNIYNQKFWLMESLISVNCFQLFESLFYLYKPSILLQSHFPLLTSLLFYLEWLIDPVLTQISPKRFIKSKKNNSNNNNQKKSEFDKFTENKDNIKELKPGSGLYDNEFWVNIGRLLKIIGIGIGEDAKVYVKLCRLCRGVAKGKMDIEGVTDVVNIVQSIVCRYLLPALSIFKCNPGVVTELWLVLQELDCKTRYFIYNELMTNNQYSNLILIENFGISLKEINKWLKRLAKDKIKHNARTLGKLSHNNPTIVFNEIIKSIKSYPNQIVPMIGALNYSSNLSLDITMFLILRHISDPSKDKLKPNDANLEGWFINISNFAGLFLKKNHNVDITGAFTYLINRLANNQTLDLILMKEIIAKMSSYDLVENLNDLQLQSLAGGLFLQMESASLTSEHRSAKKSMNSLENFFWKKTKNYVAIQKNGDTEEVSLAFLLMIYLGQQRNKILYNSNNMQLKLLGNLYDKINETFNQFMQFLRFQTDSYTHYASLLPANCYPKLVLDYKIPNEIAIAIVKHSLKKPHFMNDLERNEIVELFKEVFDKYDPLTMQKSKDYDFHLTPTDFLKEAKEKVWAQMTPELYTLFWLFTLDDIYFPKERYDAEIDKLAKEVAKMEENKNNEGQVTSSKANKSKIDKEIDKIKSTIEKLKDESVKFSKKKEQVEAFFNNRKDKMFENIEKKFYIQSSQYFIQFCILPRVTMDPAEALYCAKFIDMIHQLKKVSIVKIIENIHSLVLAILPSLQCATEREALNISIFFMELLHLFGFWNEEQKLRNEFRKYSAELLDYEQSKFYILVTHQKIVNIMNILFNKYKGYMQIRNALIFLQKIKNIFPVIKSHADSILKYLECVKNMEMSDLKQTTESYENIFRKKIESMPDVDMKKLRESVKQKSQNKIIIKKPEPKEEIKAEAPRKDEEVAENRSDKKRKASKSHERSSEKDHAKKKVKPSISTQNLGLKKFEKNDKNDKNEKMEKNDKNDKNDKLDRNDRIEKKDEKNEKIDKLEKNDKNERIERVERSDKNDRNEKNDRNDKRDDRADKNERNDKIERNDKNERNDKKDDRMENKVDKNSKDKLESNLDERDPKRRRDDQKDKSFNNDDINAVKNRLKEKNEKPKEVDRIDRGREIRETDRIKEKEKIDDSRLKDSSKKKK